MAGFGVVVKFGYAELRSLVRNWVRDFDSVAQRQKNRASQVVALANQVNFALTQLPRVVFNQGYAVSNAASNSLGLQPLHVFQHLDHLPNARESLVRIIAAPRVAGTGDATANLAGTSNATFPAPSSVSSVSFPADIFYQEFVVTRGAASNTTATRNINTYNGYTILDCVMEDVAPINPDPSTYDVVSPSIARGRPILANILEDMRGKFHAARRYNQTHVISWAANGTTGKPSPPGGSFGLAISNTTLVNVFDHSVTARNATTPGVSSHVQWCGRGPEDEDPGKRLKVMCRVYAEKDSADHGVVRLVGPEHISNNYTEIVVTGDGNANWYGTSNSYLYLNTLATNTLATANCNKIDVLAKCNAAGTLYVWAVDAWAEWE